MGIIVKPGDILYLGLNGVSAITVRAQVNLRPEGWWHRVLEGLSKAILGGTEPHNLQVDVVSTTDRSRVTGTYTITEDGEIDSAFITIIAGAAPVGPGEVWADCQILRPGLNASIGVVARGYLHEGASPSYPTPNGSLESPFHGPGRIRALTTTDPAANTEILQAVPANARVKLRTVTVQLVQGITQTPLPALRGRGLGVTEIFRVPITTTAIGASSTAQLTWGQGLVQSSFTTVLGDEIHTAPLPENTLIATDDWGTITDGIGANTNYGPAAYVAEEWIDP